MLSTQDGIGSLSLVLKMKGGESVRDGKWQASSSSEKTLTSKKMGVFTFTPGTEFYQQSIMESGSPQSLLKEPSLMIFRQRWSLSIK